MVKRVFINVGCAEKYLNLKVVSCTAFGYSESNHFRFLKSPRIRTHTFMKGCFRMLPNILSLTSITNIFRAFLDHFEESDLIIFLWTLYKTDDQHFSCPPWSQGWHYLNVLNMNSPHITRLK